MLWCPLKPIFDACWRSGGSPRHYDSDPHGRGGECCRCGAGSRGARVGDAARRSSGGRTIVLERPSGAGCPFRAVHAASPFVPSAVVCADDARRSHSNPIHTWTCPPQQLTAARFRLTLAQRSPPPMASWSLSQAPHPPGRGRIDYMAVSSHCCPMPRQEQGCSAFQTPGYSLLLQLRSPAQPAPLIAASFPVSATSIASARGLIGHAGESCSDAPRGLACAPTRQRASKPPVIRTVLQWADAAAQAARAVVARTHPART